MYLFYAIISDISVNFLVTYNCDKALIGCKCYRSMRKSEPPHNLEVTIGLANSVMAGRCSCVAGIGGCCHHVVGLLYYIALLKQLGHKSIPDELTCTMMKQRWSVPRGKKIEPIQIQDVLVKKPQMGASYSKFIKSTIYSPATMYGTFTKEAFNGLDPIPLFANIVPGENEMCNAFPSGLIIHPKCPWLGCSPDRKVYELDSVNNG